MFATPQFLHDRCCRQVYDLFPVPISGIERLLPPRVHDIDKCVCAHIDPLNPFKQLFDANLQNQDTHDFSGRAFDRHGDRKNIELRSYRPRVNRRYVRFPLAAYPLEPFAVREIGSAHAGHRRHVRL